MRQIKLSMKAKLKHYTKEILSLIIIITVLANIISYYKSTDLNKTKLDLKGISIAKNKPILIHFWATWCPTCSIEASNIQTISEHYEVLTIAVDSGDDQNINNYLKKHDLNFKVINDKNSIYSKQFNISVFPTTLIYDKNKNIIFSEVGYTSTIGLMVRMWWANF